MPDPAVVNASPLILLAKAGHLELLRALGRDLIEFITAPSLHGSEFRLQAAG